jgi:hypothetical protein
MARTIPMPSKSELPDGPRRDFVVELRRYWRAAGRPALRKISRAIEGREDLKEVTASQETIRRMLRGMVLPTEQDRVYAVFRVLCEMADVDPDAERWDDNYNGSETNWQFLQRLWDTALEEESEAPPIPRPAPPQRAEGRGFGSDDPWASDDSSGGYSDEPPF